MAPCHSRKEHSGREGHHQEGRVGGRVDTSHPDSTTQQSFHSSKGNSTLQAVVDRGGHSQAEGIRQDKTAVSGGQNKFLHFKDSIKLLLLQSTQRKAAVLGGLPQPRGRGNWG